MAQQTAATFTISQSDYNKLAGDGDNVTLNILYDDVTGKYSVTGESNNIAPTTIHDPCPQPCPTIKTYLALDSSE